MRIFHKHKIENYGIKGKNLLTDKTILITGVTGGIGRALIKLFVSHGAKVIGVARNPEKIEKLRKEVIDLHPEAKMDFVRCELSSIGEIKKCVTKITEKISCLDILINNAGGYFSKRYTTEDGYELTFALNYLSPFILTNLLLPVIKKSKEGKILNITSIEEKHGKLRFNDLQSKKFYFGLRAYAQSKLALVMFTRELAEKLKNTTVKVNAIHPGIVKTNIAHESLSIQSIAYRFLKYTIAIPPERAAEYILFALTDKHFSEMTGAYIKKRKLANPNPISGDKSLREKLWNISLELSKLRNK